MGSYSTQFADVIPLLANNLIERREISQAINAVNASGVMGADSEIKLTFANRTGQMITEIVKRKTGQVVGHLSTDYVVQLAQGLLHEWLPLDYGRGSLSKCSSMRSRAVSSAEGM